MHYIKLVVLGDSQVGKLVRRHLASDLSWLQDLLINLLAHNGLDLFVCLAA